MIRFVSELLLPIVLACPVALAWGPATALAAPATTAYVELHSHLFMHRGLYPLVRAPFESPELSESFSDRFAPRVNAQTLEHSPARIVVASLYAHPLFTRSLRESIRLQIADARRFVEQSPRWRLVRTPRELEAVLQDGKSALILHLEGASGILETENDFREFLDDGGIRIVTPLHLTDDVFGGCALLPFPQTFSNPLAWARAFLRPSIHRDPETGVLRNPRGLTPLGKDLIQALLKRKVWIDLAHASDSALEEILPLVRKAGQPELHTHTALRTRLKAERGISPSALRGVAASGGLIGLMPTEQMVRDAAHDGPFSRFRCEETESGGLTAFAGQWDEARKILPAGAITLGSDHHGGVPGLRPTCGTETSLDRNRSGDQKPSGFTRMDQAPELLLALQKLQVLSGDESPASIQRFVRAWYRVAGDFKNGASDRD
jgi:microsomal dipeptidase-like Zn-dependent dipeptidase